MDVQVPRDAIVVGVDSSRDSDRAVTWALSLAARSHQPVHLVHVQPAVPDTSFDDAQRRRWAEAGRLVLDNALLEAHQVPWVAVTSQSIEETRQTITEALVDVSRDAAMLVLGARGHGGYAGLLTGSVSQHATRHAHGTVVTVRRRADLETDRVVVGVDDSFGAAQALAFGFELASDQHAALTVIHAWRAPAMHGAGAVLPLPSDMLHSDAAHVVHLPEQRLAEQVQPWRAKFPDVAVVEKVVPGHAAAVLVDASAHASVVVVGSRGAGAFAGLLLGSVSQSVLQHAQCPVAVAR